MISNERTKDVETWILFLIVLLWNEDIPLDFGVVAGKNVMYSAWMLEVLQLPKYAASLALGLPGGPVVNACHAGDACSIPESGRCLGEGNGNPLQYFCLENSMDRGAWWATVHGMIKSQTWLSDWARTHPYQRVWFDHSDNWDWRMVWPSR